MSEKIRICIQKITGEWVYGDWIEYGEDFNMDTFHEGLHFGEMKTTYLSVVSDGKELIIPYHAVVCTYMETKEDATKNLESSNELTYRICLETKRSGKVYSDWEEGTRKDITRHVEKIEKWMHSCDPTSLVISKTESLSGMYKKDIVCIAVQYRDELDIVEGEDKA